MNKRFPPHFLWGVGTSAYQIEGAPHKGGRKDSIWDVFCRESGRIDKADTGDLGADHYHRWREDVALLKAMGVKSYRFSISWPRVCPDGDGQINQNGLHFYDALIDELLASGIEPMITLYHWDLPQALQDKGGWLARSTAEAFAIYAEVVFARYHHKVNYWITHNEPWVAAMMGYGNGVHAPGLAGTGGPVALHHMLLSHGLAIDRLRNITAEGKVGIALNLSAVHPKDPGSELDSRAAKSYNLLRREFILGGLLQGVYPKESFEEYPVLRECVAEGDLAIVRAPLDFVGINYYTRTKMRGLEVGGKLQILPEKHSLDCRYSTMWEYYPEGLAEVVEGVWRDYNPKEIIITENGCAVDDVLGPDGRVHDSGRVSYLEGHLNSLHRAIERGVPVTGYFAWSLLDNFEWTYGYEKRFGLVYVDYATMNRYVKDSGLWYASVVKI